MIWPFNPIVMLLVLMMLGCCITLIEYTFKRREWVAFGLVILCTAMTLVMGWIAVDMMP